MTNTAIIICCLLAAIGAECIPLLLPLVATAGVLARTKEKPPWVLRTPRAARRNGKVTNLTVSPLVYLKTRESVKSE